jgi:uncharacterized membrane protein YhdT
MAKKKGKALTIAIGALGAVAAVLPPAIYHFVETKGMHGMTMACEKACIAGTVIGAVVIAVAIVSLFLKSAQLSAGAAGVLLAGGAATIAAPRALGFCEMADMACRLITAPTLLVLGVLIILLAGIKLAGDIRSLRLTSQETA